MILPGIYASQISGHLFAPTGNYEAIASYTVPSGGLSSITFGAIPTGYSHLQIRSTSLFANGRMDINFNGDTNSNYSYHLVQGSGTATYAEAGANTNSIRIWPNGNTTSTSYPNLAIIDVLDYSVNTKNKTVRILNGFDQNGSGIISLNSGNWNSTAAVTSVTLTAFSSTFAQYSSFALYGIR